MKSEAKKLIDLDKKNIWHPFTQMGDWTADDPCEPLIIEKAKGNYLYDIDGKKYLDGVSSLWVNNLGHANPKIDAAVKKQLNKVSHTTFLGLTHKPAIELSQKLLSILPKHFKKVFYSDNGSTAVEIALKMAYQFWRFKGEKRNAFLTLKNAYHGDTIGAVSLGGSPLFHLTFKPLLFKAHFAPSPFCHKCCRRRKEIPFINKARTFKEHCKTAACKGECIMET
ncbi:MAG: aminotransferase class III-fold pyridoxal phosphate-dependent enzyme, partial [Endomicrobium sp.]|nr:aminotransferase class III-fold pyridoxal phosphate-dependent enzyme [Endomicrobium sp.]